MSPRQKEEHRRSPPKISSSWCYTSLFQKCNCRSCWFICIWSPYIIHTSHTAGAFFIKVTDYCQRASVPERRLLSLPFSHIHAHAYMHRNCQLKPCALMMCRQKVKGHSWVGGLTVSKPWTGVLLSVFMSTDIWPLEVTVSLLLPHLIGGFDV